MKMDWEIRRLGEVCKIVGGGTPRTEVSEYWSGNIGWVTPKDLGKLKREEIFDTAKKISKRGIEKSSAKLLPIGSVILSSRAPIGYVAIAGVELATNQGCRNFVCGEKIYNKYLYYFLFANTELLNSLGGGATFKEISGTVLKGIEIPLPPFAEQKRIVKILDGKFELIEELKKMTEQQIANAKELFESQMEKMLLGDETWQKFLVKDVCDLENGDRGKNYPARSKLHTEGIPFVNAGNLKSWREIDLYGKMFLTDKQFDLLGNGKFTKGDILFCLRGSLGKNALVTDIEKGAIASSLVILRPKEKVSKNFLLYYLNSRLCKEMIRKFAAGAAQPNLGARDLKQFIIFVPNKFIQKEIVKELDELSEKTKELELIFRKKIADLEELKKSYLAEAFAGKL